MQEQLLRKGEVAQQRIVDAAYTLFLEQGYHGTSMRQIAEQAEMTVGGIYNHFGSKEHIWEAVFTAKHPYHTMLPLVEAAQGENVADFVRATAAMLVEELNKREDLLNLMFIELVEFSGKHIPDLYHALLPQLSPIAAKFNHLRGRLRPLPLPILVRTFAGLFISYYITELLMPKEARLLMGDDPLDAFVNIYLYGILDEPGRPAQDTQYV